MTMPQMKLARTTARLSLMATLALAGSMALSAGTAPIRLVGVSARGGAVLIEATGPVAYAVNHPDPLTILIDMRNVSLEDAANLVERGDPLNGVSLENITAVDGRSMARVRVSLTRPVEYKVRSSRNTIRVELAPGTRSDAGAIVPLPLPGQTAAPSTSAPARPAAAAPAATLLDAVGATRSATGTVVTLGGNGQLTPASVTESPERPRRLTFDFSGVSSNVMPPTDVDSPLITRVSVSVSSRDPLVTRVVMDVADGATYYVKRAGEGGQDLAIVFEPPVATERVRPPEEPVGTALAPEPGMTLDQAIANAAPLAVTEPADPISALRGTAGRNVPPSIAGKPAPAARQVPTPQAAQPPPTPQRATPPAAPQEGALRAPMTSGPQVASQAAVKKYTGAPISLDFDGLDLRAILRVFTQPSGLNIIIDPGVPATPVNIVLNDIPWDQALEILLRTHQLGYEVDGTVIRIATLKVLEEEQRQRTALSAAQALAGELVVQTYALSYAKAGELSPLLVKSALSQRGQIQVDTRTNTIIVTDLPDRLQTVANLIVTLDRPEPQVEIEARIVTTTREFAHAIGVQWGLNGRMTPDLGNTTNLAFPNTGTVQGNAPGPPGTVVGLPAQNVGAGVVNTAIGIALGSVNGAFNLDLALSALERSGKGRILSTPRITTQNNVEAEITQGVQIPVTTPSTPNTPATVTYIDAALTLKVTPQITSANTVIMNVSIVNASPGVPVGGNVSIDTQRAITRVQVSDGMTTIMGGIFVSRESSATDRTPILHRIPLLGWLFQRNSGTDDTRELLIFITPRILKG